MISLAIITWPTDWWNDQQPARWSLLQSKHIRALTINNIDETVKIDNIEDIVKIITKKYYIKPLLAVISGKKKKAV